MQPRNSLAGALLGTALGDAIGLVAEGMKPNAAQIAAVESIFSTNSGARREEWV
jgi:ADP-ribosylglycohydrolase